MKSQRVGHDLVTEHHHHQKKIYRWQIKHMKDVSYVTRDI